MGTTAEKLTYLSGTKTLLKDTINLTGAGITNDTFRSYASKLKQGYLDILNNGIDTLYNNFPKVSGIGSNLSLTPTYKAPIKLNEIQGNTLQENTPTPSSPVPIQSVTGLQNVEVCGKNLFDKDNLSGQIQLNTTLSSITNGIRATLSGTVQYAQGIIIIKDATNMVGSIIRVKGNFIASSTNNGRIVIGLCDIDGNNRNALISITTSGDSASAVIPSISGNVKYLYVGLYGNNNGTGVNQSYVDYTNVILTIDDEDMTYEPYKGNTYEVNLGKNLLDINDGTNVNLNSSINGNEITLTSAGTWPYRKTNINVETGKDYTIKCSYKNNNGKVKLLVRDSQGDIGGPSSTTSANGDFSYTFTARTNQVEIRLYSNFANESTTTSVTYYNIQLEKGSTATSFSEYFPPYELNTISTNEDGIKKSNGKNLLPYPFFNNTTTTTNGITFTPQPDGSVFVKGTATGQATFALYGNYEEINQKPLTGNYISGGSNNVKIRVLNHTGSSYTGLGTDTGNGAQIDKTTYNTGYIELLVSSGTNLQNGVFVRPMMLNSLDDTTFEPYGKVWYAEKQNGKVVLNGSETWSDQSNGAYAINISDKYSRYGTDGLLCDYFHLRTGTSTSNYEGIDNDTTRIRVWNVGMSLADFKIWLGTHNTTVLYQLATPIYEVITNTELIEQLESLNNAKSKNGTTNINVTSEDLSMILNVNVLKGE